MVLSDSLYWFKKVRVEGERVIQVPLDYLEEGLTLSALIQQCLRVGTVLAIH